jgi:hypothetical protein
MSPPTLPGGYRPPLVWTIGGYTFTPEYVVIGGADSLVWADCSISGHGFDPSAYGRGAVSGWNFHVPPFDRTNFSNDVTGPIKLFISVEYEGKLVPDMRVQRSWHPPDVREWPIPWPPRRRPRPQWNRVLVFSVLAALGVLFFAAIGLTVTGRLKQRER